ncbi:unnamed protein product, partial [Heterosigma akashiwo]
SAGLELSTSKCSKPQTSEDGMSCEIQLRLSSKPKSSVSVDVSVVDSLYAYYSENETLAFTTTNWDTYQTVTIVGKDSDSVKNDPTSSYCVTFVASSSDSSYDLTNMLEFTHGDNDYVAILDVTGLTGEYTDEFGLEQTFDLSLDFQPNADIYFPINSSDVLEGQASIEVTANGISFVSWDTSLSITATSKDDADVDGTQYYTITIGPGKSTADAYSGITEYLTFISYDNDNLVSLYTTTCTLAEKLGECEVAARVRIQNPRISLAILYLIVEDDSALYAVPSSSYLTQTSDVNMTISTINNFIDNGDQDIKLTVGLNITFSAGSQPATISLTHALNLSVNVLVIDDESAGLQIAQSGTNGYDYISESIYMNGDHIASIDSVQDFDGCVQLVYSDANYSDYQTVTVIGLDDAVDDYTVPYNITIQLSSSDSDYDGLSLTLPLQNMDDDEVHIYIL